MSVHSIQSGRERPAVGTPLHAVGGIPPPCWPPVLSLLRFPAKRRGSGMPPDGLTVRYG